MRMAAQPYGSIRRNEMLSYRFHLSVGLTGGFLIYFSYYIYNMVCMQRV